MDFKKRISGLLAKAAKIKFNFEELLEVPPDTAMGDYALPCFKLAKELKKGPAAIAEELSSRIKPDKHITGVKSSGPYINFSVNKTILFEETLNRILKEKSSYGSNKSGRGKKALIEHTSINPNASPHMGRVRNAIIGSSIANMLRFEGYKTGVHYFVNDVGKQIAMLVLGARGKKPSFDDLLKIYVDFNKKLEKDPKLEKEVFEQLNKLEKGDKAVRQAFEKIVGICVKGQKIVLNELGIEYDYFDYESRYLWNKATEEIIKRLEKTGKVFVDEHGRKVIDMKGHNLPMKTPVLVLTRGDGTSLYVVRDIAYTIDKMKQANDVNLIVLGEDHKLYFQQISIALKMLGKKSPEAIYYTYVLLKGKGKMSTRQGNLVLLEDLMGEALEKAEKEIIKKHGKVKNIKDRARKIAYGAIKYSLLKVSSDKNVLFDVDEALSFEGDTGPYVQYAHARACSIIGKANRIPLKANYSLLKTGEEQKLISHLKDFPEVVLKALSTYQPYLMAHYLGTLAKNFNEFYHCCQCLGKGIDKALSDVRLALILCTKQVLENGLNLLGISAPKEM